MILKQIIYLGADHRGYKLKNRLAAFLHTQGYTVHDVGTHDSRIADYPDVAKLVAKKIGKRANLGILVCSTGIGMDIAANKFHGVRAGTVWQESVAARSRREDDVNVLCLPADYVTFGAAKRIVIRWLHSSFLPVDRYQRRKRKIAKLER